MSCISSKSSDKKTKKGKLPFKKKPKKEMESALTEEMKETDTGDQTNERKRLLTESKSAQAEDKNKMETRNEANNHEELSEGAEDNVGQIIKDDAEDVTQAEDNGNFAAEDKGSRTQKESTAIPIEEGMTADQMAIPGIIDEAQGKEDKGTEEMEKQRGKLETDNTHEVKHPVEFTIIEESGESGYVIIESPGETNDDPDTYSINNVELFTDLVDVHALGKALKGHSDMYESDLEVTTELLQQFLTKGQRKQVKMTVRRAGWSATDDIREVLWKELCQHLHKAEMDSLFEEYDETLFSNGSIDHVRLPSFVDTQHLSNYYLNKDGLTAAKKVLGVLEVTSPDIVYCPMLYPVVCLFLHFMDASECYNCVYALLRNPAFISQTKVCYEASKLVIRDLAKKHAKSGYIFLVRNSANVDTVFDTWLWWILQDLPFQYLVRVFDCYLLEGVKVLYRVTLSIITHFYKFQGKTSVFPKTDESGNPGVISSLRQFCREMPVPLEKLLKTGFGIRRLNRIDIQKLQVKNEMYVNSQRHINNPDAASQLPMSRSFSGPIVLQNMSSSELTADMLLAVWTWLPTRFAVCQPELLYTSDEHGISLVTLYQRVENHQPTIIVIKTTTDEIFGAFCSTPWKERRSQSSNHLSYFGTGETFIFTLWPEKKKYQWVGLSGENIPNTAHMFQAGDRSILTIGGGHGEAIYLDENLEHCRTEKCDTFNNEPLSQDEDFMCKVVEVYGFQ